MKDTGKRFVRDTWYDRVSEPDQAQGLPQPSLEAPEEGRRIALPAPEVITAPPLDLRAAIEQRRSLRKYADAPFSLEELAYLLWATQGVREVIERPTVKVTFRTVPSAGARHALDTYVLVNRVEGLSRDCIAIWRWRACPVRPAATGHHCHRPHRRLPGAGICGHMRGRVLLGGGCISHGLALCGTRLSVSLLDAGHVARISTSLPSRLARAAAAIGAYNDEAVDALLEPGRRAALYRLHCYRGEAIISRGVAPWRQCRPERGGCRHKRSYPA
jgi:nitroreductase